MDSTHHIHQLHLAPPARPEVGGVDPHLRAPATPLRGGPGGGAPDPDGGGLRGRCGEEPSLGAGLRALAYRSTGWVQVEPND